MKRRERQFLAATLFAPLIVWGSLPALAADSPEAAVHDVLDAIEAEALEDLDGLVCTDWQTAIRDRFDSTVGMPEEMDRDAVADAVDLVIAERTVELLEQDDQRAEVRVGGRLTATIDEALLRELGESSLQALGIEVTPEQVDDLIGQLTAQLETGTPIADDITTTLEDGSWLVCDDILVGEVAATVDATGGACAHMTVEELNAIDGEHGGIGFESYTHSSWDESTGLCTYDKGDSGIGSVKHGRFESTYDEVLASLPGGSEEQVDGRRAYLKDNDLFIEIDDGVLYVHAPAKGMPDGEASYLAMPAGIAELILPRLDG